MSKKIEVLEQIEKIDEELQSIEIELWGYQKELEASEQRRYRYIDIFFNIPTKEKEALRRSFSLLLNNCKQIMITQRKLLEEYKESKTWLMQKLRDEINSLNISNN